MLGTFKRTDFLCISVLRVPPGSRVKLASCKSDLPPPPHRSPTPTPAGVYSADRSKTVVPVVVLLFVALRFILRGDCVISFLCFFFSVLLTLRLPPLGKREIILVLFVRWFELHLFGCLFPLPLGVSEGLRLVIVARNFLLPLLQYMSCKTFQLWQNIYPLDVIYPCLGRIHV